MKESEGGCSEGLALGGSEGCRIEHADLIPAEIVCRSSWGVGEEEPYPQRTEAGEVSNLIWLPESEVKAKRTEQCMC